MTNGEASGTCPHGTRLAFASRLRSPTLVFVGLILMILAAVQGQRSCFGEQQSEMMHLGVVTKCDSDALIKIGFDLTTVRTAFEVLLQIP